MSERNPNRVTGPRRVVAATTLALAGALAAAGCAADTHGASSVVTPEGSCYPSTLSYTLDKGDEIKVSIADMSFRSTSANPVKDAVVLEAVGPESSRIGVTGVDISAQRDHPVQLTVLDGLEFSDTLNPGDHHIVQVDVLRDREPDERRFHEFVIEEQSAAVHGRIESNGDLVDITLRNSCPSPDTVTPVPAH